MNLRLVLVLVALVCCGSHAVLAASPNMTELAAQPDDKTARAWLLERFPPGAYVGDELDFFEEAVEVLADSEALEVTLFVFKSNDKVEDDWVAWIGLDEELYVVLLDATAVK